MKNKHVSAKEKIYIIIVFSILFGLAVSAPVIRILENSGIIQPVDIGNAAEPARDYSGSFAAPLLTRFEYFRVTAENIYLNYLPFYSDTVFLYSEIKLSLNEPVIDFLRSVNSAQQDEHIPDTDESELTDEVYISSIPEKTVLDSDIASVTSKYLSQNNTHRFYSVQVTFDDGSTAEFLDTALAHDINTLEIKMKSQLEEINRIIRATPENVNFYFYMASRFQDTELFELCVPDEASTRELRESFLDSLDSRAKVSYFHIDSIHDRMKKMFLSDHHWNGYGAYTGYRDIIEWMREDSPEIAGIYDIGEPFNFEKSRFYGSYARQSKYTKCWDDFIVYDYDLPRHYSSPSYDFDEYVEWMDAGSYHSPSDNLYGMFYPKIYRVDYSGNETGRNLLILGDSFTQGFAQLIASGFDTTIIYYYGNYYGLDYKKVIEDNSITDVLFFQFSDRIMFDTYNDDRLNEIKTDDIE